MMQRQLRNDLRVLDCDRAGPVARKEPREEVVIHAGVSMPGGSAQLVECSRFSPGSLSLQRAVSEIH